MKRTFFLILLAFAVLTIAKAGDLPAGAAFYSISYTNTFTSPNTNSVVGTNYIGDSLHHTFYITTTANLQAGSIYEIDFSGDAANWVAWAYITNGTSGGNSYTNCVMKQAYYRISCTSTNTVGKFLYLGGR